MTQVWNYEHRPRPDNARFLSWDDVNASDFDLAILHFDENVLHPEYCQGVLPKNWGDSFKAFLSLQIPMVAVCHGTPQVDEDFDSAYFGQPIEQERLKLMELLQNIPIVTNSFQAQREWRFKNSRVIWHGFDPTEYPQALFSGSILSLAREMQVRPQYRGKELYDDVLSRLPPELYLRQLDVEEPHLNVDAKSNEYAVTRFRNYVDALRRHSIYFNPTARSPMPRTRGEAMMVGLATVTANNHDADLFIKNGINGFCSNDSAQLAEYLVYLSEKPDEARKLGLKGRETAIDIFNHDRYLHAWKKLIAEVTT
jgi:glycosyltransferase involved in cell wall biosynthesis